MDNITKIYKPYDKSLVELSYGKLFAEQLKKDKLILMNNKDITGNVSYQSIKVGKAFQFALALFSSMDIAKRAMTSLLKNEVIHDEMRCSVADYINGEDFYNQLYSLYHNGLISGIIYFYEENNKIESVFIHACYLFSKEYSVSTLINPNYDKYYSILGRALRGSLKFYTINSSNYTEENSRRLMYFVNTKNKVLPIFETKEKALEYCKKNNIKLIPSGVYNIQNNMNFSDIYMIIVEMANFLNGDINNPQDIKEIDIYPRYNDPYVFTIKLFFDLIDATGKDFLSSSDKIIKNKYIK